MKRVVIVSFSDIPKDSRVLRYLQFLTGKCELVLIGNRLASTILKNVEIHDLKYTGKRKGKGLLDFLNYNLLLKYKSYRFIRRSRPDFVHANDFESLVSAFFAMRHRPKSVIYDSHEIWSERNGSKRTIFHKLLNKAELHIEKYLASRVGLTMTVSDSAAEYMKMSLGIHLPVVVRNIPTADSISPNEKNTFTDLSPFENALKFVYLGLISKARNVDFLIEAFDEIKGSGFQLFLIGENQLSVNKEYRNVHFLGEVPEDMVLPVLSRFDVGVHPMRTDICINNMVSLPNKIMQYINAGLALFVYKNGETERIVESFGNGITDDFTQLESVKTKILSFSVNDIDLMKNNSLKASKSFDFNEEIKEYYKFLFR